MIKIEVELIEFYSGLMPKRTVMGGKMNGAYIIQEGTAGQTIATRYVGGKLMSYPILAVKNTKIMRGSVIKLAWQSGWIEFKINKVIGIFL